jgi:3'-5' exoribonuclease 1
VYAVVWCGVVWCGVVWCGVVRCAAVCCAVLCCAVLCCAVLCCAVLWCVYTPTPDAGPEPEWVHEIIEFPLVLVDTVNLEPVDEFHAYIRPTEQPVLTHFCKTFTGISQETVDAAVTLEVALEQFAAWLAERQLGAPGEPGALFTIALATDGPWDIVNFLAPECERKGLPFPICAKHWIDARAAFAEWHLIKQLNVQKMLEWSGMVFEGRPHSGIDDTRNIARIVIHLLSQGCEFLPRFCVAFSAG